MDTKISTKAIRFGILISAATISSMSFAVRKAVNKAPAAKANPVAAKIEVWKDEVQKKEAAPVADGFVKWKGFDTIRGTKNARWLSPSDLRGRFVVIVDLDKAKIVEQFKEAAQIHNIGYIPPHDWEFTTIGRDVLVVYNIHDLSDDSLEKLIYNNDVFKMIGVEYRGYNFYGEITFEGAPDSAAERPYVYVMAPEGKEPIYKGKVEEKKTFSAVKAAITKASSGLPAWRQWYGYVGEVKHTKGFDAAVAGGKALTPIVQALKKGIVSTNPEIAAESQRLFDAIEQRKADLQWQIKKEWNLGPCAATYDIEELSKRFPTMKRELAQWSERIAKAHPNVAKVYKPYALYRRYSDPGFHVKNAAEAKKIASELEKFKPTLTKFSEDTKDVRIQNVATSLLSGIDELVAELPSKVIQP